MSLTVIHSADTIRLTRFLLDPKLADPLDRGICSRSPVVERRPVAYGKSN